MRLLHISLLLLCAQSSSGQAFENSTVGNVTGPSAHTTPSTSGWSSAPSSHVTGNTTRAPSQTPPHRSSTGNAQFGRPTPPADTIRTTEAVHPPASSPAQGAAARCVSRGLHVISLSVLLLAKP